MGARVRNVRESTAPLRHTIAFLWIATATMNIKPTTFSLMDIGSSTQQPKVHTQTSCASVWLLHWQISYRTKFLQELWHRCEHQLLP